MLQAPERRSIARMHSSVMFRSQIQKRKIKYRPERHLTPFGKRFVFAAKSLTRFEDLSFKLPPAGDFDKAVGNIGQSSRDRAYCASGDSIPEASFEGTTLRISGFTFNKISALTFINMAMPDREFIRDWIPHSFPLEIDGTYHLPGQTFEQACLHTLTADMETLN